MSMSVRDKERLEKMSEGKDITMGDGIGKCIQYYREIIKVTEEGGGGSASLVLEVAVPFGVGASQQEQIDEVKKVLRNTLPQLRREVKTGLKI